MSMDLGLVSRERQHLRLESFTHIELNRKLCYRSEGKYSYLLQRPYLGDSVECSLRVFTNNPLARNNFKEWGFQK